MEDAYSKKRKLIDLSSSTIKALRWGAAQEDMSLKAYIEKTLNEAAKELEEDAALYRLSLEPEANTKCTEEEEREIKEMLGL